MKNIDTSFVLDLIKKTMKEKNVSQLDLSKKLGVSQSTLIRNFKGETEMGLSNFIAICMELELMGDTFRNEARMKL